MSNGKPNGQIPETDGAPRVSGGLAGTSSRSTPGMETSGWRSGACYPVNLPLDTTLTSHRRSPNRLEAEGCQLPLSHPRGIQFRRGRDHGNGHGSGRLRHLGDPCPVEASPRETVRSGTPFGQSGEPSKRSPSETSSGPEATVVGDFKRPNASRTVHSSGGGALERKANFYGITRSDRCSSGTPRRPCPS